MHRDPEYMVDILDAARSIKTYVAEKTENIKIKPASRQFPISHWNDDTVPDTFYGK